LEEHRLVTISNHADLTESTTWLKDERKHRKHQNYVPVCQSQNNVRMSVFIGDHFVKKIFLEPVVLQPRQKRYLSPLYKTNSNMWRCSLLQVFLLENAVHILHILFSLFYEESNS
jgi:hypothetical protein